MGKLKTPQVGYGLELLPKTVLKWCGDLDDYKDTYWYVFPIGNGNSDVGHRLDEECAPKAPKADNAIDSLSV